MTIEKALKKQYGLTGITKYHEMGYTGKGIVILNHEVDTGHAKMTNDILKGIAPDATIINADVTSRVKGGKVEYYFFEIDGVKYTPEEMYEKYHPDIMSVSFCGHSKEKEERIKPLIDKGLVVCCATGNEGTSKGDYGMYADIAISIGSVSVNEKDKILLNRYSGRGEVGEVTFVAFNATGDGTSAATPFFSGMVALLMSRFGKMTQDEVIEVFKNSVIDIDDDGLDATYGYGVPVLPDELEVDIMKFKDVNENDWFYKFVNALSDEGIINGYEDGTFQPNNSITRAEVSAMMYKALEKVREEIKK